MQMIIPTEATCEILETVGSRQAVILVTIWKIGPFTIIPPLEDSESGQLASSSLDQSFYIMFNVNLMTYRVCMRCWFCKLVEGL